METGESMRKKTVNLAFTLLLAALLIFTVQVPLSIAAGCGESCLPCHGNLEAVHGNYNHAAEVGNGTVAIFPDTGHDDAGRVGNQPFFGIHVDCGICHNNDLPAIHGNDCATCHPTPYDTLGLWGRGCQQGGCHSFFHENITQAHAPFDTGNYDCNVCHDPSFSVKQAACLNCHSANTAGDVAPPVTTANIQPYYSGTAKIDFSVTDNGKVGIGRTFYRLDGGPVIAARSSLVVTDAGAHELEFWSMDQAGNTEAAHNHAFFSIEHDATPPTTLSNAQSSYYQGAVITLTATDNSTLGVKTTWYSLNGSAFQPGTQINIPATSGTFTYTLTYYSEDWSGNVEINKSVSFTVISGSGTLRLVWGGSDVSGSPCRYDPEAYAAWTIHKGSRSGPVVQSGSGGCPDWSGVDDVAVPISTTPYYVIVDWWDSEGEYMDQTSFSNVNIATPGAVIRLNY